MRREYIKYLVWVVCVTIWMTLCFIAPDFIDNPHDSVRSVLTIGAYLCALGTASLWIIYIAGLNKYIAFISIPLLGTGGAVVSYYRVAFHATITPMIIDATLHTNGGTIAGVVSWQLIGWIVLNITVAIGFCVWRRGLKTPTYAWLHAIIGVILLFTYYTMNGRLRSSINQRYPYNVVHNLIEYKQQQVQLNSNRITLPYTAKELPDSIDVVFVLGEAARADHLQLNGYERETTPLLAARKNIVSFPHIYSEATYTSTSVPVILSPADSLHPTYSGSHTSFIHIMNECGFRSAWISNQDNGRTYVSFIHEADTIIFPNASKSVFVFDPWYDEQLLPPLDSLTARSTARNLYVLHTIGSHWYYNLHVPEAYFRFTPATTERVITNNTEEQIINSYDNTIAYMDVVLDSLIQRLENRCAILIYLSDHGEALGEGGVYLHAAETEALHLPACVVWYSDKYAKAYPDKTEALIRNKDKRYRTDFLYHSILSAAGIETEGNCPEMNIFR